VLTSLSRSEWTALGALLVSAFSAWQAFRSRRIAERAYQLSYAAHRRSQPSLELYLVEGYIRPVANPARRVCVFKVRITNQSDAANGLKAAALKVAYRKPGEVHSNVIVHHDPGCAGVLSGKDYLNVLQIPQSMAPREVVGGAALFPIPDDLIRGARIESYTLSADSHNQEVEQEAILLWEVSD
jgi:hypothetical protein